MTLKILVQKPATDSHLVLLPRCTLGPLMTKIAQESVTGYKDVSTESGTAIRAHLL